MSRLVRLPALLLTFLLAARADALEPEQLPSERGLYVGIRAGYAFPLGRFDNGPERTYLSQVYSSAVPLQVDLGYRITPHVRAGLYAMYAPVQMSSFCPGACSAKSLRLGVSGEFHLLPSNRTDPWAGLGVGYERSSFKVGDVEARYSGLEWMVLQAGADYRVGPKLTLGPTFTWTFANYSTLRARVGSGTGEESIRQRALHSWMMFGARAQLSL
jgi:outer membrane protein W